MSIATSTRQFLRGVGGGPGGANHSVLCVGMSCEMVVAAGFGWHRGLLVRNKDAYPFVILVFVYGDVNGDQFVSRDNMSLVLTGGIYIGGGGCEGYYV